MPAASAAATLTITSPAPVARCESRSDVDDITERRKVVDGCTKPGRPKCHARVDGRSYRNGHRGRGAGLRRSLGQVNCCSYRNCRVVRPADAAEEEPNNLIAHDFVNDAVMSNDRIRCQSIERSRNVWKSAGRIRSPMPVEPRISENGRVIGISTPVIWRLRSSAMHLVQRAGFPGDCLYPACLKMRPPSPANGAAHSLQRGGYGIPPNTRRCLARPELSPVSTARTRSGVNPSAAIWSIYPRRGPMPSLRLTAAFRTAAWHLDPAGTRDAAAHRHRRRRPQYSMIAPAEANTPNPGLHPMSEPGG
jgi:hypothetical protein